MLIFKRKKMEVKYRICTLFCTFFLVHLVCLCECHFRSLEYELLGSSATSTNLHANGLSCARSYADNSYIAARVGDDTGSCEGLQWDWGSNPEYDMAFTYIRKTKSLEKYNPALSIEGEYIWYIPGTFGEGGYIHSTFEMPSGNWTRFSIELTNTTDTNYDLYSGDPEVIMVGIYVDKSLDEVTYKTWSNGWTLHLITTVDFTDGAVLTFQYVPLATEMQLLAEGLEIIRYPHPADPSTARMFKVTSYTNTIPYLHQTEFVGV